MSSHKPKSRPEDQNESEESTHRKIRYLVPESLPVVYANNAGIRITPWDFKLVFGRIGDEDEEGLDVEQLAVIYCSPQHAKSLATLLVQQLATYESKFGPIHEPDLREAEELEGERDDEN